MITSRAGRSLAAGTLVIGALSIAPLGAQQPQQQARRGEQSGAPVAITIAADGKGFVLQDDGAVVGFQTDTNRVTGEVYRVPAGYHTFDLAASQSGGTTTICITVASTSKSRNPGSLLQWSSSAPKQPIWSWLPADGLYVGVAIDHAARAAYVTNIASGEVYRVPVGGRDEGKYAGRIKGADRLGVVAFDARQRRLIGADVRSGDLHALDLDTGVSSRLGTVPYSDIRAMAIDPAGRALYVADAGRETLWKLDLGGGSAKPIAVLKEGLSDPAGLAFDPAGRLWLADKGRRALFRLAPDGTRVDARIPW